ncbi:MAG: ACP S-malonyltransferase, partial [Bacteroidota bacterium]
MSGNTAFVFPAFITSFTLKELDVLYTNKVDLNQYIQRASNTLNIDLPDFDYHTDFYKKDELLSQIIAYTFSCAFSDLLFKKDIQPDYVAGYSMGIYASLYSIGAIGFEGGIKVILKAFQLVNELSSTGKFGMGAIIGLSFNDIRDIIIKNNLDIEIININNERSIVVAGVKSDIMLLLDKAQSEGAFSVSELTVNTPYHSKYLKQYSDRFNSFISGVDISDTKIPIISTYDQREIHS